MKNDIEKLAEKATEMQRKVYELVASGTKDDLLMSSAILMKTAIELYTVILPDEAIESMLTNEIVNSIPAIREKMQGTINPTVHGEGVYIMAWLLKNNTATIQRMKKFVGLWPSVEDDPLNDFEMGRDIRLEIGYNYLEWKK